MFLQPTTDHDKMLENDPEYLKKCRRLAIFRQAMAACIVCLQPLSSGVAAGWISPMAPLLTSNKSPIPEWMDLFTIASLGSMTEVGAFVSTFFWGIAVDRLGRKTSTALAAIPFITCWVLILFANSSEWILIARFILGTATFGTVISAPIFITEIAQDDLRGLFGGFFNTAQCIGILLAYSVGTYFKYYGLAIAGLVIPCVFLMSIVWLPETPLYLYNIGEVEKAAESLLWYRGGDTAKTEDTLLKYKSMPKRQKETIPLKILFATRGTRKALLIGLAVILAIHGSGTVVIVSFAVTIFQLAGTPISSYECAIILAIIQVIGMLVCCFVMDSLGRRSLILFSQAAMTITMTVLGLFLVLDLSQPMNSIFRWVPVMALSVHLFIYCTGTGGVHNILLSEIFLPEIRGLAHSVLALISCSLTFTSIKLFPYIAEFIHIQNLFFAFGVVCLLLSIFFCLYLPETKNIPQNEIINLLNGTIDTLAVKREETQPLLFK